jgi:hypothetical protein
MDTHTHNLLRTRPDIAALWSDEEVATRWLTLCPNKFRKTSKSIPTIEEQIKALASCSERIAVLRKRLSCVSWFMAEFDEYISRAANKEDNVKGHFWAGRFQCQVMLDDAATISCMSYVDLNLVRAKIAPTPEDSDFTSIQERIRAWKKEQEASASNQTSSIQNAANIFNSEDSWLCPIQSNARRTGILQMTELQYFELVDRTGRMVRSDKRGSIDPNLAPILTRIGAIPETWNETISSFGSKFRLAVGSPENLRKFAAKIGNRWIKGMKAARSAFALSSYII